MSLEQTLVPQATYVPNFWNVLVKSVPVVTTTNALVQGGNSFGATLVTGTKDNNAVHIETNGVTAVTIATNGDVTTADRLTVTSSIVSGIGGGVTNGELTLLGLTSGSISQIPAASTTSYTVTWPAAQGAGALTNDGSGILSFFNSSPLIVYPTNGTSCTGGQLTTVASIAYTFAATGGPYRATISYAITYSTSTANTIGNIVTDDSPANLWGSQFDYTGSNLLQSYNYTATTAQKTYAAGSTVTFSLKCAPSSTVTVSQSATPPAGPVFCYFSVAAAPQ